MSDVAVVVDPYFSWTDAVMVTLVVKENQASRPMDAILHDPTPVDTEGVEQARESARAPFASNNATAKLVMDTRELPLASRTAYMSSSR